MQRVTRLIPAVRQLYAQHPRPIRPVVQSWRYYSVQNSNNDNNNHQKEEPERPDPKHQMLIAFTCKVCNHRTHHIMSKGAYSNGVVVIQCPECKNRHLIADHLGWFKDGKGVTVEDLVKEHGEEVNKIVIDNGSPQDIMQFMPKIAEEEKRKRAK